MSLTTLLKTFNEEKVVVQDTESNKFIEKDAYGVSLKGVLQRGRLKLIKERPQWPQGPTFRPSGITYHYCRRAKVGQLAGLMEITDPKPAPKLQLVFDMGHAIHDIFQGYFWDIGLLKGTYSCLKCDKKYEDLLAPKECPKGHGRKYLRYEEINLNDAEHRIKGRTDGILIIDDQEHIMDIKSIANRTLKTQEMQFTFEDLAEKGPKADHVVQLNLYMHMSGVHRGHLLYVAKNDHMVKTFAIPYDYEIIRPYLEEIAYLIDLADRLKIGERVELPAPCSAEICSCEQIPTKL